MKLEIVYDGSTLFDGEVSQIEFERDKEGNVSVTATEDRDADKKDESLGIDLSKIDFAKWPPMPTNPQVTYNNRGA